MMGNEGNKVHLISFQPTARVQVPYKVIKGSSSFVFINKVSEILGFVEDPNPAV